MLIFKPLYLSLILLALCLFLGCENPSSSKTKPEREIDMRSYFSGKRLYLENCSVCHGKKGEGNGRLYPPLAKTDYLRRHLNDLPCITKYGISGKIIVNGKDYNVRMLGFEKLNNQDITDISNYIRNSWGNSYDDISKEDVESTLQQCQ